MRPSGGSRPARPRGCARWPSSRAGWRRRIRLRALAHFERVLDVTQPWHSDFVARWAVADAIEAAVSANAYERARELVARGAAFPHPSRWLEASVAYGRLLIAADAEADALRRCRPGGVCGAARRCALGCSSRTAGILRRRRRAGEARALLRAARDTFEALDMGTFAERARSELRAAGEAVRVADVNASVLLSPQELQIAQLAAGGPVEPRHRPGAVPLAPHDRLAPVPDLPEARGRLARRAARAAGSVAVPLERGAAGSPAMRSPAWGRSSRGDARRCAATTPGPPRSPGSSSPAPRAARSRAPAA